MDRTERKKPDADGTASSQRQAAVGSSSPHTVADAPSVVQDPDAPDEVRVARLATWMRQRAGERGSYVAHHPEGDHEPDAEIWWVQGGRCRRVAHSLPGGGIIVTGDAIYSHAALVEAGDHVMGDGFCAVGGGR